MIFIGLGSNVGERMNNLTKGLGLMTQYEIAINKVSSLYETPAWGNTQQNNFLNAVIEISFPGTALELLSILQEIEKSLGRTREVKWGPRTLDLDILSFRNEITHSKFLQIPHPFLHERAFVLLPWTEIAPEYIVPGIGKSTHNLLQQLPLKDIESIHVFKLSAGWNWNHSNE
jgi:2-amino-4-hydroxy-6-hydroxymethyldihydropteridine diphosphokinase